jgi:hypothetical protein
MAAAAGMQQVNASMLPTFMQRSRSRKTDAEVGCLLHANQVSGAAHQAVWRSTSPGLTEYQLEAEFVRATMAGGCLQLGYPCIVGAGPNAGVLHYERNAATLQQQDLVLIDAGAEFRCYTADITRTFPAAGRFSAAQRDVYEAVLATQLHALDLIKPGECGWGAKRQQQWEPVWLQCSAGRAAMQLALLHECLSPAGGVCDVCCGCVGRSCAPTQCLSPPQGSCHLPAALRAAIPCTYTRILAAGVCQVPCGRTLMQPPATSCWTTSYRWAWSKAQLTSS